MNGDWDLGGYTFGELRDVWNTLKTLQSLHQLALQKLPRQRDRRRLNIRIQPRTGWISEIAARCGLAAETVRTVFADLIYNPALYEGGRKRAHVMYQPFFDVGNDEIAQSNALVLMSGVEKCAWILTELLRPKIHDRLKGKKERFWIDNDFKTFESPKLRLFPHIGFTLDGKRGDIDLLMLDPTANFGLVSQLKWTTSSDSPAGVESDDRQYARGVQQAIRSLEWVEKNRMPLARRLGMSDSEFESTVFRPIVIAKETLPSGIFPEGDVPVINEALLRWILKDPHTATLEQLWRIAADRDYFPREGIHFQRYQPPPIVWGSLEFTLDDVAYVPLERRWDPSIDIKLS